MNAEEIVFSVVDTGRGVAEADLPHPFDRFFQTRTTRSSGVGLGLAIARGVVEAHGGRIWAESGEGRGSTFRFTLPVWSETELASDEPHVSPRAGRGSEADDGTEPVRVLMVDDHPTILRALEEIPGGREGREARRAPDADREETTSSFGSPIQARGSRLRS
jgi:hypothetical protein